MKRTVVLVDSDGIAGGILRLDGIFARLGGGLCDECVVLNGQRRQSYAVAGGRFVLDGEPCAGTEFVLTKGGLPLYYGAIEKGGDMHGAFIRAVPPQRQADACREECVKKPPVKEVKPHQSAEFYASVKDALNEMFTCYPEERSLMDAIPGSVWVRIKYAQKALYVIGLMKDGECVRYICYGVPGRGDEQPPAEMRDACQWIPTPGGANNGYWVMFQDAKTGETLKNGQ